MSVPMKKPPTDQVEVIVSTGASRRFVGPQKRLRPLLILLRNFDFQPVPSGGKTLPLAWETLAGSRINRYTKPGLALRGARIKEGMTQTRLAKQLSVPQYNLSKMETGHRPIGKKMARRLGRVLRVDYRIFL